MAGGDANMAGLLGATVPAASSVGQMDEATKKQLELVNGLGQYAALNSR